MTIPGRHRARWATFGAGKGRHAPEGRGLHCRRRALSPAPCAIAGNRTRCTCAVGPLGYRSDERRIRDGACAGLRWFTMLFRPARIQPDDHAAATSRVTLGVTCIPYLHPFSRFHVIVSQYQAHGLVPEVFSDEISVYFVPHLLISDWTGACVRG